MPRRHNPSPSAPPEPAQCHKCHACHVKRRCMSPSATHATRNEGACRQVPHLPRETKVDVTKCHACHAKRRCMSPSAMPATQNAAASPATNPIPSAPPEPAQCHKCHAHMSPSATPATWNGGGCRQVPRLPRKEPQRHRRLIPAQARHEPAQCHKFHACHVKRRHMSPSARPATQWWLTKMGVRDWQRWVTNMVSERCCV